jgi:hypothetical protein
LPFNTKVMATSTSAAAYEGGLSHKIAAAVAATSYFAFS